MTSRPDLLAIDMKRQGRFGLALPLFAAQGPDDVMRLFEVVAKVKKIAISDALLPFIREQLGERPLTGSDVESILIRAKEAAVLAGHDDDVQLADLEQAVHSLSIRSTPVCFGSRNSQRCSRARIAAICRRGIRSWTARNSRRSSRCSSATAERACSRHLRSRHPERSAALGAQSKSRGFARQRRGGCGRRN
jgi:hypothetical protein